MCRAVTNGEWKLPKHILLGTTIRHLYRCKKLTTILSRLGHCESYSFCLDMEIAMDAGLSEMSCLLTPQIITGDSNLVFHVEWDNLNRIMTNVHGSNVINSTGGIMIQEVKSGCDSSNQTRKLPSYNRKDRASLPQRSITRTLEPFHIHDRKGPKFPNNASFSPPIANTIAFDSALQTYRLWLMSHFIGST